MRTIAQIRIVAVCCVLLSCNEESPTVPETTAGTEEQPGCESGNGFDAYENEWKDTVNLEL